ncbi:MAG: hypothetical protein IJ801_01740 [Lachnospiraceae bacterium]|nr:hypothetical protein [Lachnospiraceae bacterium]
MKKSSRPFLVGCIIVLGLVGVFAVKRGALFQSDVLQTVTEEPAERSGVVDSDDMLRDTLEADLNHTTDGLAQKEPDKVEIYTGTGSHADQGRIVIYSNVPANDPYWIEVQTSETGWVNLYLVHQEEKDYILELAMEDREGNGSFSYQIYYFEEQVGTELGKIIKEEGEFSFEGGTIQNAYDRWKEKTVDYLLDARLLLSTQDGQVKVESDVEDALFPVLSAVDQKPNHTLLYG